MSDSVTAADVARWSREVQGERLAAGKPRSKLLDRLAAGEGSPLRLVVHQLLSPNGHDEDLPS